MSKKLIATLAAMGAIALSANAFANTNMPKTSGFYMTAQAGYSMSSKIDNVDDNFTIHSHFSPNGPILPMVSSVDVSIHDSTGGGKGLAGRFAAGYQFNQYLAIEGGAASYQPLTSTITLNKYTLHPRTPTSLPADAKVTASTNGTIKTNIYVLDLLAKVMTPNYHGFYAYAKAGAAGVIMDQQAAKPSVNIKIEAQNGGTEIDTFTKEPQIAASNSKLVRPEAVAGVAYNITQNITADVSYSYIVGKGKVTDTEYLPNLSFASLGLAYKF